jgi:hypothetical protein
MEERLDRRAKESPPTGETMREPDYDKAIAQAAREFIAADMANNLHCTKITSVAADAAKVKLWWMIEAEAQGKRPEDYQPES